MHVAVLGRVCLCRCSRPLQVVAVFFSNCQVPGAWCWVRPLTGMKGRVADEAFADVPLTNPITGSVSCCARCERPRRRATKPETPAVASAVPSSCDADSLSRSGPHGNGLHRVASGRGANFLRPFLQRGRRVLARCCPGRVARHVRSRRKLTVHPPPSVGQPTETCLARAATTRGCGRCQPLLTILARAAFSRRCRSATSLLVVSLCAA